MARWLYGLAHGAVRRRWIVLAVWVVLLAAAVVLGTAFKGTLTTEITIPGIESQRAIDLLAGEFPAANGGTIRAVFAAPAGTTLDAPAAQQSIASSLTGAKSVPGVIAVSPPTLSQNKTIGFADVIFAQPPQEVPATAKDAVEAAMQPARAAGLRVEFGGTAATEIPKVGGPSEAIGVVVAFIVLLITLGSLVAAGLPLVTALLGVGIGVLGVQFVSRFVEMTSTATTLALMIGLAVGIDYALFIVSRHREQLADPTLTVAESIGRAIGTAGSAVVFAGSTVVIALAALAVMGIPFLTIMGLAAAATVAIAVLVALTLVPALLGFAGERVRPKARRDGQARPTGAFWLGWGRFIQRAPAAVLIVGIVILGVLASPALHMRLGLPGNEVQPKESTLRQSYELLTQGFGPGFNATIVYVIDASDVPAAHRSDLVSQVAKAIGQDPDVAAVTPPTFNPAKTIAILNVVPRTGPDDDATVDLVHRLRDAPAALVRQAGGIPYVTGLTPVAIDVSAKLGHALPRFVALIVVLALILLAIAFRSVIVPIKAVLGFLLTIVASLGLTVWIFQDGHLMGLFNVPAAAPIVSFVPVLLIGVLFGLAMDYEVFLVSRMREHFHHSGDAVEAVLGGLQQSGRVVCAAALIMASVFGGFLFSDEPIIKSIAFALTVGVLIDAFVVRMTLVPAVMFLLGRRAWRLPRWLDRLIPNVDIEGASLPRHEPAVLEAAVAPARRTEPNA